MPPVDSSDQRYCFATGAGVTSAMRDTSATTSRTNQHCRDRADEFISGVLDAIALDAIVFTADDEDDDADD
jgi:hypothetical protein